MKCRVLECGECFITQHYGEDGHLGVDIVANIGGEHRTDYVVAHSSGRVVDIATGHGNEPGSTGMASYGNYVQIQHDDGYTTFYAHLDSVYVSVGDYVDKGQRIGYMGNTGNSYGAHTHFEVRTSIAGSTRVNPEPYLNSDLPSNSGYTGVITYQAHLKDGDWLPEVNKCDDTDEGYAGIYGNEIDAIKSRPVNGKIYLKSHTIDGEWLDEVCSDEYYDGTYNSYSGILGVSIDLVKIRCTEGFVDYRVHIKGGDWLPWVNSLTESGTESYAGLYGKEIDGIQMK